MTLLGCSVMWAVLALLIVSAVWPPLRWVVAPILVGFLLLQALRWVVRRGDARPKPDRPRIEPP
jgi:hypothetical protein